MVVLLVPELLLPLLPLPLTGQGGQRETETRENIYVYNNKKTSVGMHYTYTSRQATCTISQ